MKKYAQLNKQNKIHHILEIENLPPFHPSIKFVEITGMDPMPQEGWNYNQATGEFVAPDENEVLPLQEVEKVTLLMKTIAYIKENNPALDLGPDADRLIEDLKN